MNLGMLMSLGCLGFTGTPGILGMLTSLGSPGTLGTYVETEGGGVVLGKNYGTMATLPKFA